MATQRTSQISHPDLLTREARTELRAGWLACLAQINKLIKDHPNYASAYNNKVQLLRALHGDDMLVRSWLESSTSPVRRYHVHAECMRESDDPHSLASENISVDSLCELPQLRTTDGEFDNTREQETRRALDLPYGDPESAEEKMRQVCLETLETLTNGIVLLERRSYRPVSPRQASLLARLHMQRGILYQGTPP